MTNAHQPVGARAEVQHADRVLHDRPGRGRRFRLRLQFNRGGEDALHHQADGGVAAWPGATSREMEQQVTEKIETKLQELPYINFVNSYTKPARR